MGEIWVPEVPDVLAAALNPHGFEVDAEPGYETRSRRSGGYIEIRALGLHHDAWRLGTPTQNRIAFAWYNSADKPIGATIVDVFGNWIVGAAGATNTQGKGGPVSTSKGTIPLDSGNSYIFAVEPENDGVGQPWPEPQVRSLVIGFAALMEFADLEPGDILAHFEWTDPGETIFSGTKRKIDPAGPSPYAVPDAVYLNMWDMDAFRRDVAAHDSTPAPPAPPAPPQEDDMPKTGTQTRVDSRTAAHHETLQANEVREVWLDLPEGARFAQVNCVFLPIDKTSNGFASIGSNPPTEDSPNSTANWSKGDTRGQESSIVWVKDGRTVWIQASTACEFVIDFTGVYW